MVYEVEADWADALESVPSAAGKAGAATLRHKILDAMAERLPATLEQHALRQQEASAELRRVDGMVDHRALWLFVLLPPLRRRELDSRREQECETHRRWQHGVRLVEDGVRAGGHGVKRATGRSGGGSAAGASLPPRPTRRKPSRDPPGCAARMAARSRESREIARGPRGGEDRRGAL